MHKGNGMVSQQNYEEAKKFYLSGISLFLDELAQYVLLSFPKNKSISVYFFEIIIRDANRSAETETLLVQMFNNMAFCDLKLKNYNSAMDTCSIVFSLTSNDEPV